MVCGWALGSPHFGLTRLGSPAISADRVRRWLEAHADDLPAPLATVRVLALPSAAELPPSRPGRR